MHRQACPTNATFRACPDCCCAAKPLRPRLRQLEKDLSAHSEAKGLQPKIARLHSLIQSIETATGTVELRGLDG